MVCYLLRGLTLPIMSFMLLKNWQGSVSNLSPLHKFRRFLGFPKNKKYSAYLPLNSTKPFGSKTFVNSLITSSKVQTKWASQVKLFSATYFQVSSLRTITILSAITMIFFPLKLLIYNTCIYTGMLIYTVYEVLILKCFFSNYYFQELESIYITASHHGNYNLSLTLAVLLC